MSLPSSIPQPKPPTSPLAQVISLHLNRTDELTAHLRRIVTTTSGVDTSLILLGYGSHFVSALLNQLINLRVSVAADRAVDFTAKAASRTLAPGETLVATLRLPENKTLVDMKDGLKALGGVCSDVRAFMRLWGLLGIYAWARRLATTNEPKDGLLRVCAWVQVIANTAYLLNEHPVYLAGKGILRGPTWTPERIRAGWQRAGRWFAVHAVFEFIRLWRSWVLRQREARSVRRGEKAEGTEEKVKRMEEVRLWWKSLLVYIAYAPMCVHWSVEGGFVSDGWYGFLGMCAGILGVREVWRQTA